MEVLRKALVEANGGSTKLDYKTIRRNVELLKLLNLFLS